MARPKAQYPGIPGIPPGNDPSEPMVPALGGEEAKSSSRWRILLIIIMAVLAALALYLSGILTPERLFPGVPL